MHRHFTDGREIVHEGFLLRFKPDKLSKFLAYLFEHHPKLISGPGGYARVCRVER